MKVSYLDISYCTTYLGMTDAIMTKLASQGQCKIISCVLWSAYGVIEKSIHLSAPLAWRRPLLVLSILNHHQASSVISVVNRN